MIISAALFNFEELIESFLNGNISYIKKSWLKMSYFEKDEFIDYIDLSDILTSDQKFSILRHLLKSTF